MDDTDLTASTRFLARRGAFARIRQSQHSGELTPDGSSRMISSGHHPLTLHYLPCHRKQIKCSNSNALCLKSDSNAMACSDASFMNSYWQNTVESDLQIRIMEFAATMMGEVYLLSQTCKPWDEILNHDLHMADPIWHRIAKEYYGVDRRHLRHLEIMILLADMRTTQNGDDCSSSIRVQCFSHEMYGHSLKCLHGFLVMSLLTPTHQCHGEKESYRKRYQQLTTGAVLVSIVFVDVHLVLILSILPSPMGAWKKISRTWILRCITSIMTTRLLILRVNVESSIDGSMMISHLTRQSFITWMQHTDTLLWGWQIVIEFEHAVYYAWALWQLKKILPHVTLITYGINITACGTFLPKRGNRLSEEKYIIAAGLSLGMGDEHNPQYREYPSGR